MPYCEQSNLYQEAEAFAHQGTYYQYYWDPSGSISLIPNPAMAIVNPLFVCTSDPRALQPQGIVILFEPLLAGITSYLGIPGLSGFYDGDNSGMLVRDQTIQVQDVTDGLSNTIMVGERPPPYVPSAGWFAGNGIDGLGISGVILGAQELSFATETLQCPSSYVGLVPGQIQNGCDQAHYWSFHPGGCPFLFADGSVQFLSYSANSVFAALATRNGGEAIGEY